MGFEDWKKGDRRGFYYIKGNNTHLRRIFEFFSNENIKVVYELATTICTHEEQISLFF